MSDASEISPAPQEHVAVKVWYNEDGGISIHITNKLGEDVEGSDANINLYCWVRGVFQEGITDPVKYSDLGYETLDLIGEDSDEVSFPTPLGNA